MSTSPDRIRPAEDRLVTLLSHWLTRTLTNEELRSRVEGIGTADLGLEQAEAVGELLAELGDTQPGGRGGLEMVVRETLESLAMG